MAVYQLKSRVTVEVRTFEPADALTCSRILLRNFKPLKDRMPPEEWKGVVNRYGSANLPKIAAERKYSVALVGREVVGLIGIILLHEGEVELSNLSLKPEYWGQRIGTLLVILELIKRIEEGITHILGDAGQQSRRILLPLGFKEEKTEVNEPSDVTVRLGAVVAPKFEQQVRRKLSEITNET